MRRRPTTVWLIFVSYCLSAAWLLLSLVLVPSWTVPLDLGQNTDYTAPGAFDYATDIATELLSLAAAVSLFRLRRAAVPWFTGALALGLAVYIRTIFVSNWIDAFDVGELAFASLGWLTTLSVLLYAMRLRRTGILT